eukprot:1435799-Rhodomonas_salina.2
MEPKARGSCRCTSKRRRRWPREARPGSGSKAASPAAPRPPTCRSVSTRASLSAVHASMRVRNPPCHALQGCGYRVSARCCNAS